MIVVREVLFSHVRVPVTGEEVWRYLDLTSRVVTYNNAGFAETRVVSKDGEEDT
jgi:hypothetical protein